MSTSNRNRVSRSKRQSHDIYVISVLYIIMNLGMQCQCVSFFFLISVRGLMNFQNEFMHSKDIVCYFLISKLFLCVDFDIIGQLISILAFNSFKTLRDNKLWSQPTPGLTILLNGYHKECIWSVIIFYLYPFK